MRISVALLGVLLVAWIAGSLWYYRCHIQQKCPKSAMERVRQQKLVVSLDGYDDQAFYIRNSAGGTMELQPADSGADFRNIVQFLSDHPGSGIDLITANESQASGLQAVLILSGVPNNSIRLFTDRSLGSDKKPLRIVGIPAESGTPEIVENPVEVKTETVETERQEPEPAVAPAAEPVERVTATLPCPTVTAGSHAPALGPILYGPGQVDIRCQPALGEFARAALPAMDSLPAMKLLITGHADIGGDEGNAVRTGLLRATEIKKYLIKQGLPGQRLETYSRGSDQAAGDNATESGRQQNRRVTLQWQL